MSWRFLFIASSFLLVLSSSIDGQVESNSGQNQSLEWQVLTKRNFSSQIHLHQHLILMVTVPWSGESRALMKELADVATYKLMNLDYLTLMVIYKNKEKMLANILGATAETTIFVYDNAVPYKYQGRLRAQYILSSVSHFLSLQSEELPLKVLNTTEDINTFFQSTDKALLLLEVCGWTSILLGQNRNNASENALGERDVLDSGIISRSNRNVQADITLTPSREKNQKGLKNKEQTCGIENAPTGIPWLGGFTVENDSVSSKMEDTLPGFGLSCTFEKFKLFESFFSNFTTVAREFFLPPERQRFGLVSERSLMPFLGVQDPESWLVMLHFAGCPNCSKILKEGDDLRNALDMNNMLVTELESEAHDVESALPANEPSIILFVDRSSESPNTRRKSEEALELFRKLALNNQVSYQMAAENIVSHKKFSAQAFPVTVDRSTSNPPDHLKRESLQLGRVENVKNEMSVVIIDNGKKIALENIPSDAKGRSLQDILTLLLQQKKEAKLSLLAKEAGFQLLSDDFEIKLKELLPQEKKYDHSEKTLLEAQDENIVESGVDLENNIVSNQASLTQEAGFQLLSDDFESKLKDLLPQEKESGHSDKTLLEVQDENIVESGVELENNIVSNQASLTQEKPEEPTGGADFEPQLKEEKIGCNAKNTQIFSVYPDEMLINNDFGVAGDMVVDERHVTQVEKLEEQQADHQDFKGFYFFSDGGYRLLQSLSGRSIIPSIVIVDPISEQHYIYPEEASFSYSSLKGFLDAFLNGRLIPYQRSESIIENPREVTRPPFINMDFHEVDSVPRVTAHTFRKQVLGYNESDTQVVSFSWKKDVLVLFSNSWCGFCQRMELVIREVFRAFEGYMNTLKRVSTKRESNSSSDSMGDAMLAEVPQIYLMDCTLNDCSSLLKSIGQRELYPALMLFPAQSKTAVSYQGDMSVNNVIEFVIHHGSNSNHLHGIKGTLWSARQKEGENGVPEKDGFPFSIHEKDSASKYHKVSLNYRAPIMTNKVHQIRSHTSDDLHEGTPNVVVGSVLISTDKLVNAPPFDESVILIVQANHATGFLGLIINKHITWDSFEGLETGLEIVKQAPLSFGGPLVSHKMPLVSLTRGVAQEGYLEVFPSVCFLDQLTTARALEAFKAGNQSNNYWFFLGYSGWEWNQLFSEIAEGAWQVSDDPKSQFHWPGN